MKRCAHCCPNVAPMAPERLIAKLKNQREFTQMAYLGAENAGALARVNGVVVSDVFGFAKS